MNCDTHPPEKHCTHMLVLHLWRGPHPLHKVDNQLIRGFLALFEDVLRSLPGLVVGRQQLLQESRTADCDAKVIDVFYELAVLQMTSGGRSNDLRWTLFLRCVESVLKFCKS